MELYGKIRASAELVRQELLFKKVLPEELPLLEKAARETVVLQVEREIPTVYRMDLILRRSRSFAPLAQAVGPAKHGFLKLLLRSLLGAEVNVLGCGEITQTALRAIHNSGNELPVVFDDIGAKDVREKVEPVLKSLYEVPLGTITPVVLSLNAGQNYAAPDEVRKRALLVWTGAVLDTTNPKKVHQIHAEAQKIVLAQGNRLYRAFLPRLLKMLEEETDWLYAATKSLAELLRASLGDSPEWAVPVSLEEVAKKNLEEVRKKVSMLLKTQPIEWKQGRPTLKLGFDSKRYARELPGWLVDEAQGEILVLKKKGLRRLGLLPRWWNWF